MKMWRKLYYRLRPRRFLVVRRNDKLSVRLSWTEAGGFRLNEPGWALELKAPGAGYVEVALFRFRLTALACFLLVNLVEIISAPDRRR